ncbi:MAG: hypothetical protein JNM07_02500 [Phycisphaerae bacterium]|nr:hypothetical protein [Phycisphaerae bacterium]
MKKLLGISALLAAAGAAQADTLMTFEDLPGDVVQINNFYTGVVFGASSQGSSMVTRRASTNNYNISSWPSGTVYNGGYYWIYDDVGVTSALDQSGNDGKISFTNADATYVEVGYSCNSSFFLEAYRADGTLIDSDTGGANLRFINGNEGGMGTLRVDWNGTDHIAWVIVHDTGNFWVIDNVKTDASGVSTNVPLPTAAGLGFAGVGLMAARRRRA